MSESTKAILKIALFIVVALVLANVVIALVFGVFKAILPIAIVLGIGYVAYKAFAPKALGGSNRRILP